MPLVFLVFAFVSMLAPAVVGTVKGADWSVNHPLPAELTGNEGCDALQQGAIRERFREMNLLFTAAHPVDWEAESAVEYFGSAKRVAPFKKIVEENLSKASPYSYTTQVVIRNPDIDVRCDDPHERFNSCNQTQRSFLAYNIGNQPHIVFCPGYFNLGELDDVVKEAPKNDALKDDIDGFYNRATAWARQVMHISEVGTGFLKKRIVNSTETSASSTLQTSTTPMGTSFLEGVKVSAPQPYNLNYVYGAVRARWMAALSPQTPQDGHNNPENYAFYALARYIEKAGHSYLKNSVLNMNGESTLLTDERLQDSASPKYGCFDQLEVVAADNRIDGKGTTSKSGNLILGKTQNAGQAFLALVGAITYCVMMPLLD